MAMLSREACSVIADVREEQIVVCTMTTIMMFAQQYQSPLNIRVAPLMGGASSIGLGLALACPERRVLVLDGDGSLAMQLGTLLTIGDVAPKNLYHFLFRNNLLYEGGGRVPIAGAAKADFSGFARCSGYAHVEGFSEAEVLKRSIKDVLELEGPVFVELSIRPPDTPRWSNSNPHDELPDWWFVQLRDDAFRLKAVLGTSKVTE